MYLPQGGRGVTLLPIYSSTLGQDGPSIGIAVFKALPIEYTTVNVLEVLMTEIDVL